MDPAHAGWRHTQRGHDLEIQYFPGKWTGLLLHVVGGEYFGQIQLLLALSETPQTDIEESTTQLIPPLALLPL